MQSPFSVPPIWSNRIPKVLSWVSKEYMYTVQNDLTGRLPPCRGRWAVCLVEPESYAGWSLASGRIIHTRQVKGEGPDKERSTGPPSKQEAVSKKQASK